LGPPAPWAHLDAERRSPGLDDVRRALAAAGPVVRSPREHEVAHGAAVLAALYEDAHAGASVVLTRRSGALRAHGGEVSFPGGRREPGEHLADTARREAFEEVGLDPGLVEIVGELDHLTTITSGSFIVPYVAVLPGRPELEANPSEVEAILHVPLRELLDPAHYREERWDIFQRDHPIFFFDLVGDTIWGATAAMLRQLLGLVTGTVGRGELHHL
jgi:8-oxo-dGTP pyrophosphatase MutT (NUDIX family)